MTAEKPKVVIIGGGTGLSVLLRGLKWHPIDLTAIVTVADDGGSSGRLRNELNIPPPGDIRNVLAALSDVEPLVESLFQHRFSSDNELSGHALGNLMIAALSSITGDFGHAIQEMSKVLNVRGQVLPAANESVVLHAEMEDGTIVSGESKIPYSGKKIHRVFLSPVEIQPIPEAIRAIQEADMIILGPGSLYTSILPNLLVPGIGEAVCESSARKVYICNLMTQAGETLDFTAADHVRAIYDHMECSFMDVILVNKEPVPANIRELYKEEMARPVIYDVDKLEEIGMKVIFADIITFENLTIRHDTAKVADILVGLIPKR